ncbi:MAG: hypothetical protein PHN88_11740 [Ignavibacteria bacterium]|nr:hypothetical protein [Ignavibacteria bacterium]
MKKLTVIVALSIIFSSNIFSQDLGGLLTKVGADYAQQYLKPFTTGLGTNLNSGFIGGFNPGGYSKIPVWPHFYVGVKFCGVVMQDADKTFDLSFSTTQNGQTVNWVVRNAPTVFGSTTPAVAYSANLPMQQTLTMIGGVEESKFVPLFIPQIGIGTIFGTDLTVRALPGFDVGNYGSFKLLGFGLRHNIGAYAKMPFDISVQFGYQTFGIKDKYYTKFIDANSYFVNLQLSKKLAIVTLYGGAQYENYSVDVNYNFGGIPISFNQKGDNSFRGILGATLSVGPLNVNADLNYGSKFAFTAGFGLGM